VVLHVFTVKAFVSSRFAAGPCHRRVVTSTVSVIRAIDGSGRQVTDANKCPKVLHVLCIQWGLSVFGVTCGSLALYSIRRQATLGAVSSSHDLPLSFTDSALSSYISRNGVLSTLRSTIQASSKPKLFIVLMRLTQRLPSALAAFVQQRLQSTFQAALH
jgi:hypothetical protein